MAITAGRHDTVGADLTNHCVDDILVQGARPLFVLDYIAVGKMDRDVVRDVIRGFARACRENKCALIGGETAEMPGTYQAGDYDLAATIVGVVERRDLLPKRTVRAGDVLIGVPSSGLHTNGYSLARRVLLVDAGFQLGDRPDELGGASVGDALLAVHRSYLRTCLPLVQSGRLTAMAHITGGGLPDNVPRVLPKGTAARIDTRGIPKLPICNLIVQRGKVERSEAWRVLNMGVGMVLFVRPEHREPVIAQLRELGEVAFPLGEVVAGEQNVELT